MKSRLVLICLALAVFGHSRVQAQDTHARHGEFTCFFGVLHAHCVLSPDFSPRPSNFSQFVALVGTNDPARFNIPNGPVAAWMRAAQLGRLDFLALTDHVHGPES
jgi:hypothetical protein